MEDLKRYLTNTVEPTIADFEANPTSVRHALVACVVTFHSVDYLAHPRKPQVLRQKFGKESPDFLLVDQVAHAFKHVVTGVPSRPDRHLHEGEVIPRPPALWDQAKWDVSHWDDSIGGVTIAGDAKIDLLAVLKRTVAFLRTKIT